MAGEVYSFAPRPALGVQGVKIHVRRVALAIALGWALSFAPARPDEIRGEAGCGGDYYWAGTSQVCLREVASEWLAIASRNTPLPIEIQQLGALIQQSGLQALRSDRSVRRYGLLLVPRATAPNAGVTTASVEQFVRNSGSLEILQVYRRKRSLFVLVNDFTVQFRPTTEPAAALAVLQASGATIKSEPARSPGYVVRFDGLTPLEGLRRVNALHGNPQVRYAKPNFEVFMPRPALPPTPDGYGTIATAPMAVPSATPKGTGDDPHFPRQWYLDNDGTVGRKGADVNAARAWGVVKPQAAITIAVLDEGVETTHEDLAANIVGAYDAIDQDDDQEPQKGAFHGTACAGVAAAVTGNSVGIKGLGTSVGILPVRIAEVDSSGGWNTSASVIADGIRTAVDRGAHVLSASWFYEEADSEITDAVDSALQRDRVLIFAAGNEEGPVDYPASLADTRPLLAVSATNEWDRIKTTRSKDGETNWGSNFGAAVTVSAPGVHIFTTALTGKRGAGVTNYMADHRGTSAAVPLVSGAAALILSQEPGLKPSEVRDRLARTAKDLGPKGWDKRYGWGRIDACRALGSNDCAGDRAPKSP